MLTLEGHQERSRIVEMGANYMNYMVHIPYIVQVCSEINAKVLLEEGATIASDIPLLKIRPKGRKPEEDF